MRLDDINSFWPSEYAVYEISLTAECHWQQRFAKNVTKIYCEVNKINEVTLNKTTSLQVKVFSKNSTSLHDNYLK